MPILDRFNATVQPAHGRLAAVALVIAAIAVAGLACGGDADRAPSPPAVAAPAPESTHVAATAPARRRCIDEDRLARTFAPALALAPDDQKPRPVEMLLDRARLVYHDGDRVAEESRVDAVRLAALRNDPEAYLKLPPAVDDRQAQQRIYEEAVAGDKAGRYAVTAYARVHCAATTAGLADRTVIQYWLFYLYNDYANVHEGDWELVQIVLDGARRPLWAAYAQHNSYSWRRWDEVLVDERDSDADGEPELHPRVYVARGSHASYFQYAPNGYGGDRVADAREFVVPSIRLLPSPEEEEPAFGWLKYAGRWGMVPASGGACKGCGPGPVGPVYNSGGAKWKTPLEWGGQRLTRDDLLANGTARVVMVGSARTHVYDEQQRHTGPRLNGGLELAIPGAAHITQPGTRATTVLLPGFSARTPGRVEIEGGEIKSLRVLLPGDPSAAETVFPAVALAANGLARLDLSRGPLILQVDADGDGRFERSVLPDGATAKSGVQITP